MRRARTAGADGVEDPRAALAQVLAELEVQPGDPAWADGRDVVGEAYERLVPAAERRRLGQFFTPLWIGRVMAEWLLCEPTSLLLDAGCGSGALLIAAAHARGAQSTRLLGVDADPLALRMAKLNVAARGIRDLDLRRSDFLLDEVPEQPDAIICNPPFTRHHDVPVATKAAIHQAFERRLSRRFSHLASLHVLFLVRALEVSSDDARIAFITPSHWLDMNYGREIKRLLLERAQVEAIVSFPADELLFAHARTTAAITLIRKGAPRGPTRIVRVDGDPSAANQIQAALTAPAAEHEVELASEARWTRRAARRPKGIALGELAHVHRGAATGCNAFFVLSEMRRRELGLQPSSLRPCAASPRHVAGAELHLSHLDALDEAVPRWLLAPTREGTSGPLGRYLALGKTKYEVTERHLVKQRVKAGRRWFDVEAGPDAPIILSYFNRPRARFVRNRAGAVPLNTWLIVQPNEGINTDALFALLSSDEVMEHLPDGSRVYGRGLWKLEPSDLLKAWVPADALERVTAEQSDQT